MFGQNVNRFLNYKLTVSILYFNSEFKGEKNFEQNPLGFNIIYHINMYVWWKNGKLQIFKFIVIIYSLIVDNFIFYVFTKNFV